MTRPRGPLAVAAVVAVTVLTLLSDSSASEAVRQEPRRETFAVLQALPAEGAGGWASALRQARRRGARYALLPQFSVDPQPVPGPLTDALARSAREFGIWIAFTVPERNEHGHHLSTVLLDDQGGLALLHRQVIVPAGTSAVRGSFRDTVDTVDVDGFRLGIVAADDAQAGVPRLADRGADVILVSTGAAGDDGAREALLRRLAEKYAVTLILAASPAGAASERARSGAVYGAKGELLPLVRDGGLALASVSERVLPWRIPSSLGLPASVPFPVYQPPTPAEAELGRRLFVEKGLSATGTVACSTCHDPLKAFAVSEAKGTGILDRQTKRNVPSLFNVAFRPLLQWDGYASSLENFAKYPINGFNEMGAHYLDTVVPYLRSRPDYVDSFRQVMGVEAIEFEHVARALATFQRTLISGNSAFDRYRYGGEPGALDAAARRGLELFVGRADCARCHVIGERYALFTDLKYHDLGVGYQPELAKYSDIGLGGISTDDFSGLFQTPSLRNVAETAPYMHDGSVTTLAEAVDIHDRGGLPSPHRDPTLRPLGLTRQEKQDLVTFLRSLSGDQAYSADARSLSAGLPRRETAHSRGNPHAPTASPAFRPLGLLRAPDVPGQARRSEPRSH